MTRDPLKPLAQFLATPLPYWLGVRHFKKQRWEQADACFEEAIRRNPEHARSYFKRGQIAFKAKKWEAAFLFFERAVFLEPLGNQWMNQYRQALRRLDEPPVPGNEFTEAEIRARIAIHGNSAFLYSELAKLMRTQRKWWQELDALEAAIGFDEGDAELHFRMGVALEAMQRFVEAAKHFERAVQLDPGNALWHFRLGFALQRDGHDGPADPGKAALGFEKAIAASDDENQPRAGIGAFYQEDGRWDLAAGAYMATLEKSPDDADLHFRIGMCHDRCYEWKTAEEWYVRAIRLDAGVPYWHFRLGFVRERQGDFTGAAAAYQVAALSEEKRSFAWSYRLACVLEKLGRHEEACQAFLKSLRPDDIGVLPVSDPSLASRIDALIKSLADDATDAALWWELGEARAGSESWTDAFEAYRQCAARTDVHGRRVYHRMGWCLLMMGRHEEACARFRDTRILQRPQGVSEAEFRKDEDVRRNATYTEFYETLPLCQRTVLYESFHGKVMSCNPYAMFLHLLGNADFKDWTHVWVIDDKTKIPPRFKRMTNVVFISRDTDAYMRCLASARLLINNVTFPGYFIRKEGQIYLNTWHGTPWKMMGKDVRGEFMIYGNVSRNFLQASHLISPNRYTTDILTEKYDIDGIYRGVTAETGYPRIDLTLNAGDAEKAALKQRLGVSGPGKVVLYAPTWRGTHGNPAIESAEVMNEVERLKSIGCHVLFRGHTLSGGRSEDINVPDDIATNELLSIVDVLVTDYSSIFFDFIATGRPIVFYLKDYEEYSRDRGLYFGVEELPGEVAYRLDDLVPMVERAVACDGLQDHPQYAAAAAKFCPVEDGHACRRVVDLIFSSARETAPSFPEKSVLVYGGGFLNSGITASLLNLLNGIDHSKVRVSIAVEPVVIGNDPDRVSNVGKLPAAVRKLPRSGSADTTLEERVLRSRLRRITSLWENDEVVACYKALYAREFRRLFGISRFDVVMDSEGYNAFWSSVLSCAPAGAAGLKTVYQHSDKVAEWKTKYPQLESMFHLYRFYDRIISVSKMTMENNIAGLCGAFHLPASKFDHVENMLDPAEIRAKAGEGIDPAEEKTFFRAPGPVFMTVGRLSIEKDHEKLIRAFASVRKSHPSAKLLVVGDGPLMTDLERLVADLRLAGSVFLTGYRGNPFPYLAKADCFVLSSNHEGQPMVLLEAMVLNKPILSTDIIGARGVLEGRSGQLVENSVEGLAGGMLDFIAGKITAKPVDMEAYQRAALQAFYQKACGFAGIV